MKENKEKTDTPAPAEKPKTEHAGGKINALALISYIGILFVVPLLTKEKDEFVKFHAKQGLVLFICEAATWIVLAFVPVFGWMIANLLDIIWLILSIIGIVNVVNGKKEKLPVIGEWADKFKV